MMKTDEAYKKNELLRLLLEQIPAVMWSTDLKLRFTTSVGAGLCHLNLKPNQVVGMSLYDYFQTDDPEFLPISMHRQALTGKSANFEITWQGRTYAVHVEPFRDHRQNIIGTIGIALDISEHKQAELALQNTKALLQSITENSPDYIMMIDQEGKLLYINRTVPDLSPDRVIGTLIYTYIEEKYHRAMKDCFARVLQTGRPDRYEVDYRDRGGKIWSFECRVGPVVQNGQVVSLIINASDVTDRKQAGESLRIQARQQAVVAELGQRALSGVDLSSLMDEAVTAVAQTLGVEYCKVLELLPEGKELLLRAGTGWKEGCVGYSKVSAGLESQAGYTLRSSEPVIVEDLRTEKRFSGPSLLQDHGVTSGMSVIIYGQNRPYGVLGVHTARKRNFSSDDIHFLQAIANVLAAAIERKSVEDTLEKLRQQNELILSSAGEGICGLNQDGHIIFINPAGAKMLGYEAEDIIGRPVHSILNPSRPDTSPSPGEESLIFATLKDGVSHHVKDEVFRKKDGTALPVEYVTTPIYQQTLVIGAVIVFRDITWRKAQIAALEYHALHDSLTNLPNRVLLRDRIQQAILDSRRDNRTLALMLMDLDRFKEINDTLGHHYGDLLLQQVGARLRSVVWQPDIVARLGGDEFAILLPTLSSPNHITLVTEKILGAFASPFTLEELTLNVGASIGIVLCPEHGHDADTLLRRADVAMYVAKQSNSGYAIYAAELDHHSPDRLALIAELRKGIESDQLVLHFQPKISLKENQVLGVEALVRWAHPTRGIILPDQFITLAEQTGFIKSLTLWVLDKAIGQCRAWNQSGFKTTVAVNLSARSLQDPQLPKQISDLLKTHEIEPQWLELEITESSIMADPPRAMETLKQLSHIGVCLSIDDFGTGYSSLANLKKLPVDAIKIDKSFVLDMTMDEDDAAIVRSTIDLGHNLGLQVIAEGVETQIVYEQLKTWGCDAAQGYYISRPLPVEEFNRWLKRSDRSFKSRTKREYA